MKYIFRNLPLRRKIALFTSVIVGASLLTLTLITILQERSYSEQELEEQASILLSTLPYSIRDELYFVELDELKDVAAKIGESKSVDRFVIYDRDGVILADSTKIEDVPNEASLDMPGEPDPFGVTLISLNPEEERKDWLREDHQFVSGQAVHLNNEPIGAVAVTLSTQAFDEKINTLIRQSVLLTLVVILAGVVLSVAVSQQISNPLRELMDVAHEMASGEDSLRVEINSSDEIGRLGLAFNEMTEAVQTRRQAWQELNASLEQKVEERTEELRQRNEELIQMAISDPLTKINNRRYFFELAAKEYERAKRYHHPLSLVLVDADRFKAVNDTHGHLVGDEVLKNLARFLVGHVRNADVVARYGGEEFVILMPEIRSGEAKLTAERLRKEIAEFMMVAGTDIQITSSFGIACWDSKEDISFETLLYRADKALYHAKDMGRNRVSVWGEDIRS